MTPKLSSFIFVSNERCFSFQYQTEAPFINQCTFVSSLSKRGRFQWWKRLAWVRKTYMLETFEKTWNSSRVTVVDEFILWCIISLLVFVFWAQKMFSLFFSWLASGQKWREFKIKARRNSWAVEHRSQFPVPPAESDEEDEDTSWLGHEINTGKWSRALDPAWKKKELKVCERSGYAIVSLLLILWRIVVGNEIVLNK